MKEPKIYKRNIQVSEMRKKGMSLNAIGSKIGLTKQRISQIVHANEAIESRPKWCAGLSTRAYNAVRRIGYANSFEVFTDLARGDLRPNRPGWYVPLRGYGNVTHRELCRWLGVKVPRPTK